MLFVLRILPSYKRWQQKVVMLLFAVNFVVTAYACLMFGISCVPFRANWQAVPDTKCFSKKILTMANQINAGNNPLMPSSWSRFWLLICHSALLRLRYRYCFDTSVPSVERKDEGENQAATKYHVWPWSDNSFAEHCSSGCTHRKGTHGRHYL